MAHLRRIGESFLCSLLVIFFGAAPSAAIPDHEIDVTGVVNRIVDGDTFNVVSLGRVRLADIDTPEVGEHGAKEATDYLASLVHNRLVYLDVDDFAGTDAYGRIVAMVYVRHNATHLLNVNEALLRAGLARVVDFPNDFDPATWTSYVDHTTEGSLSGESPYIVWRAHPAVIVVVVFAVILLALLRFRKRPRS